MTTNRLSLALIALALAGGLSACSASATPDASPSSTAASSGGDAPATTAAAADVPDDGPIDVCGLITTAQLETAFGSPFEPGEATHHERTGGDQCVWGNIDAPPVKVFSIGVSTDADTQTAFGISNAELFDQTKALAKDPQPVDLGDQAFVDGSNLWVLVGGTSYDFTVTGTSELATDGMQTLAAAAIESPIGG